MATKDENEIDAFIKQLTDDEDSEYPLPEKEPIRYDDVDVLILPKGYKGYPTPDSKQQFSDSLDTMKLNLDDVEITDNVLRVPVTVASSKHIYDYDGLKVRKTLDELKSASEFSEHRPITRGHPKAGIVTDRREILGFFTSPVTEDEMLKGILEITDKDLIADVKEKRLTDVSPGFFCDLNRDNAGDMDGAHYDATQEHIFLDHVAIVEEGRCSIIDGCGIGLDAKMPMPQTLVDKIKSAVDGAKTMKNKELESLLGSILKGVTVDTARKESVGMDVTDLTKIKKAFTTVITERDSLRSELDSIIKVERDALIDNLTSIQDTKTKSDLEGLTLDALKKELTMVKDLQVKRLSGQDSGTKRSGRSQIDEAYSKIGV
jgi:hypothetical protein